MVTAVVAKGGKWSEAGRSETAPSHPEQGRRGADGGQ